MKIYFAWISPHEAFNGAIHNREDEKIFHLDIGQKEAAFAHARVTIQNPGYGLLWPRDKQHCAISLDGELAFRGQLLAMPTQIKGELVTLDFTAISHDMEAKKAVLCSQIKEGGSYDRLFFGPEPELKDLLQGCTALPYWHRTTGEVTLSDILRGRQHLELGGRFFRDSLNVTIAQEPIAAINVELHAQWLQQARGSCEVGQHIKRACPRWYISTLTPESLEQSWWRKGLDRQNGYQVVESRLTKLKPRDRNTYPATSPELWHMADKPKKVQFPRSWYDVQLRLGWSYRQKRRETALFVLKQDVQDLNGQASRTKTLVFNLASILGKNHFWQPSHIYSQGFHVLYGDAVYRCIRRHQSRDAFNVKKWQRLDNHAHVDGQAARATFFPTDRGQQAIGYALEVAKAHLAASARCITVSLTGDLRDLKDVTMDHTMSIQDPRLPGGTLKGKVTGYRFIIDGKSGERMAEVRLGVAIGNGVSVTEAFPHEDLYGKDDIWEENPSAVGEIHNRSVSALCFRIRGDQSPPMGIHMPAVLSERELIQDVEVLHEGDKQNRRLAKRQYPHNRDMKAVLKEMPTDVRIKLKDLTTHGCLDHTVQVDVLTTWSAPQHINLSAATNQ
jgi:hypothetical protein